jgi:hypothetical protein
MKLFHFVCEKLLIDWLLGTAPVLNQLAALWTVLPHMTRVFN